MTLPLAVGEGENKHLYEYMNDFVHYLNPFMLIMHPL